MLGRYENFPETVHGIARFAPTPSIAQMQEAILHALYQLNHEICDLERIVAVSLLKCEVSFEFGVAEAEEFNYLDEEELNRFRKSVVDKTFSVLDFFCVVRYHVNKKGKRVPLKFDYHLLRFMFYGARMELRVTHERGAQHVSLEELIAFIAKRVNEDLSKKRLKPLTLECSRTL
ncbi:MAG: hypothetical protein JSV15_06445 [Candidatus Bathyarchaeota archaeon]|nr:MAG: hypothetical protein JSV15_06445 [Candidatus Bathyarchaeota archaeon]